MAETKLGIPVGTPDKIAPNEGAIENMLHTIERASSPQGLPQSQPIQNTSQVNELPDEVHGVVEEATNNSHDNLPEEVHGVIEETVTPDLPEEVHGVAEVSETKPQASPVQSIFAQPHPDIASKNTYENGWTLAGQMNQEFNRLVDQYGRDKFTSEWNAAKTEEQKTKTNQPAPVYINGVEQYVIEKEPSLMEKHNNFFGHINDEIGKEVKNAWDWVSQKTYRESNEAEKRKTMLQTSAYMHGDYLDWKELTPDAKRVITQMNNEKIKDNNYGIVINSTTGKTDQMIKDLSKTVGDFNLVFSTMGTPIEKDSMKEGEMYFKDQKTGGALVPNSFFSGLMKKYGESALDPQVVEREYINSVNKNKYGIYEKYGFVGEVPKNTPEVVSELLQSNTYLNSSAAEKRAMLVDLHNRVPDLKATPLESFIYNYQNTFTPALDLSVMKAMAKERLDKLPKDLSLKENILKLGSEFLHPRASGDIPTDEMEEDRKLDNAKNFYEDLIEHPYEGEGSWLSKMNPFNKSNNGYKAIPFLGSEMDAFKNLDLYIAAKTKQKDLSPGDAELLEAAKIYNAGISLSKNDFYYSLGKDVLPRMVSFIGEMGATKGISEGTGLAFEKLGQRALEAQGIQNASKWTLQSINGLGKTVDLLTQTSTSGATLIPSETLRRMTPQDGFFFSNNSNEIVHNFQLAAGDDFATALTKSYLNQLQEVGTEKVGDLLQGKVMDAFLKGAKLSGKAVEGLATIAGVSEETIERFSKLMANAQTRAYATRVMLSDFAKKTGVDFSLNPQSWTPRAIKDLMKESSINSYPMEVFEEFLSNRIQPRIEGEADPGLYDLGALGNETYQSSLAMAPLFMFGLGTSVLSTGYNSAFRPEYTRFGQLHDDILNMSNEEFIVRRDKTMDEIQSFSNPSLRSALSGIVSKRLDYNGEKPFSEFYNEYTGQAKELQSLYSRIKSGKFDSDASVVDAIQNGMSSAVHADIRDEYESILNNHAAFEESKAKGTFDGTFSKYISTEIDKVNEVRSTLANYISNGIGNINGISEEIETLNTSEKNKESLRSANKIAQQIRVNTLENFSVDRNGVTARPSVTFSDGIRFDLNEDGEYVFKGGGDVKETLPTIASAIDGMDSAQLVEASNVIANMAGVESEDKVALNGKIAQRFVDSLKTASNIETLGAGSVIDMFEALDNIYAQEHKPPSSVKADALANLKRLIGNSMSQDSSANNASNMRKLVFNVAQFNNVMTFKDWNSLHGSIKNKEGVVREIEEPTDSEFSVVSAEDKIRKVLKGLKFSKLHTLKSLKELNASVKKFDEVLAKLAEDKDIDFTKNGVNVLRSIVLQLPSELLDFNTKIEKSDSKQGSYYDPVTRTIHINVNGASESQIVSETAEEIAHSVHHALVGKSVNMTLDSDQLEEILGNVPKSVKSFNEFFNSKKFDYALFQSLTEMNPSEMSDEQKALLADIKAMLKVAAGKSKTSIYFISAFDIGHDKKLNTRNIVESYNRYKMFKEAGYSNTQSLYYATSRAEFTARVFADYLIDKTAQYNINEATGVFATFDKLRAWTYKNVAKPILQSVFKNSEITVDNNIVYSILGEYGVKTMEKAIDDLGMESPSTAVDENGNRIFSMRMTPVFESNPIVVNEKDFDKLSRNLYNKSPLDFDLENKYSSRSDNAFLKEYEAAGIFDVEKQLELSAKINEDEEKIDEVKQSRLNQIEKLLVKEKDEDKINSKRSEKEAKALGYLFATTNKKVITKNAESLFGVNVSNLLDNIKYNYGVDIISSAPLMSAENGKQYSKSEMDNAQILPVLGIYKRFNDVLPVTVLLYSPENKIVKNGLESSKLSDSPEYFDTETGLYVKFIPKTSSPGEIVINDNEESQNTEQEVKDLNISIQKGFKSLSSLLGIELGESQDRKIYSIRNEVNGFDFIKKKLGETTAKAIRESIPSALDQPQEFYDFITEKIPVKEDIPFIVKTIPSRIDALFRESKKYVESENKNELKSPEELLSDVGFTFHRPKTLEDLLVFKQDFRNGEVLCTFNSPSSRMDRNFIFWIRRNEYYSVLPADELTQEYLKEDNQGAKLWRNYLDSNGKKNTDGTYDIKGIVPSRQDPYGTSSMSVQVNKSNGLVSIKNRYNHTVNNPDSTFGNDLNSIVDGLEDSVFKLENIKKSQQSFDLPENIASDSKGRLMRFDFEENGVYFGKNSYLKNGQIITLDKNSQRMFDVFLVDSSTKTIKDLSILENELLPSITNFFENKIEKIVFEGNKIIAKSGSEYLEVEFDKDKNLTRLFSTTKTIGDYFLFNNKSLLQISLPNIQSIGDYFLFNNKYLLEISLPDIQSIGTDFIFNNNSLLKTSLPSVQSIGNYFLYNNKSLSEISIPNVQSIGNDFLSYNKSFSEINIPNVQSIGNNFLSHNNSLSEISLPNVQSIGDYFLYNNNSLLEISIPNVQNIGNNFLSHNNSFSEISIPNVQSIDDDFLFYNKSLSKISLPNVQSIGNYFLLNNNSLSEISLPNVQSIGDDFLFYNKSLSEISLPNVQSIGNNFLLSNNKFRNKINSNRESKENTKLLLNTNPISISDKFNKFNHFNNEIDLGKEDSNPKVIFSKRNSKSDPSQEIAMLKNKATGKTISGEDLKQLLFTIDANDFVSKKDASLFAKKIVGTWREMFIKENMKGSSLLKSKEILRLTYFTTKQKIADYAKDIDFIEKMASDAEYRSLVAQANIKRRQAFQKYKRLFDKDVEFYRALQTISKINPKEFTENNVLKQFIDMLSKDPHNVNIEEFKKYAEGINFHHIEYRKQNLDMDESESSEHDDEFERQELINYIKFMKINANNAIGTRHNTDLLSSKILSIDPEELDNKSIRQLAIHIQKIVNSKSTNRAGAQFWFRYNAAMMADELEDSMSEVWNNILNKKVASGAIRDFFPYVTNGKLHWMGNVSVLSMKDQLNVLDGLSKDYSGSFVKKIFEPIDKAYDDFRRTYALAAATIDNNGYSVSDMHEIGVHWLLNQKPDFKVKKSWLEPGGFLYENGFKNGEIKVGEILSHNSIGLDKQAYDLVNKEAKKYIGDSIVLSFGEKPEGFTDKQVDDAMKDIAVMSNRNKAEVEKERQLLFKKTGYSSVKDLVNAVIDGEELKGKNKDYLDRARKLFDDLKNGKYTNGTTLKYISEVISGEEFRDVKDYAPILRYREYVPDEDMLEEKAGSAPNQRLYFNTYSDLNVNTAFLNKRTRAVMALNTNAFEMGLKRLDQQLFYMKNEEQRAQLVKMLETPLFKDGNIISKEVSKMFKDQMKVYFNRGMTQSKLDLRRSGFWRGLQTLLSASRILTLSPITKSIAQLSSSAMALQTMDFGGPVQKFADLTWAYNEVVGTLFTEKGKEFEDFLDRYAFEISKRGVSDIDIINLSAPMSFVQSGKNIITGGYKREQNIPSQVLSALSNRDKAMLVSMLPLLFFDRIAARVTFMANYKNLLEANGEKVDYDNPNLSAIDMALQKTRSTQATDNPLYRPAALANIHVGKESLVTNPKLSGALGELLNQSIWTFKSFSAVETATLRLERQRALDAIANGDVKAAASSLEYLSYNMLGKLSFQYLKLLGSLPILIGAAMAYGTGTTDDKDRMWYAVKNKLNPINNLYKAALDYEGIVDPIQYHLNDLIHKADIRIHGGELSKDEEYKYKMGDDNYLGYIVDAVNQFGREGKSLLDHIDVNESGLKVKASKNDIPKDFESLAYFMALTGKTFPGYADFYEIAKEFKRQQMFNQGNTDLKTYKKDIQK